MSNFEEEYYKRIRRVAGITDDSVKVELMSGREDGYWDGYCDTCRYFVEGEPFVKIVRVNDEWPYRQELVSFSDMGELIRELDNVEL